MILEFQNEYRFLSNFTYFEKPLEYKGIIYHTNEHFYQAMKTVDTGLRLEISQHPLKGLKKFCNSIELRSGWDDMKIDAMKFGCNYKFSDNNPVLLQKLINTGDAYIQEGNRWGDIFWGIDLKNGLGKNNLGIILMDIRERRKN